MNELWSCEVEHRQLISGVEYLYDILVDSEYASVPSDPRLNIALHELTEAGHAQTVGDLQRRVSLTRPYIPDQLYQQYRSLSGVVGRVGLKAARQKEAHVFAAWTDLDDGGPDSYLRQMAAGLLAPTELDSIWTGVLSSVGTYRPLRPLIDAAERGLLHIIDNVLRGMV